MTVLKYDETTKKWYRTKSFLLTNNTEFDITVSEIGIENSEFYRAASTGIGTLLLFRKVLDEPFTVPAGQTVTYNHKLEFQMPTV